MAEVRIPPLGVHVFPAGLIPGDLELDNRHNVAGPVQYQIGAAPTVTVPIAPNVTYEVKNIHQQQVTVSNGLPNSLYCLY